MKNFDVIIAGGGMAGCAASIASARNGAKTLLIERYGSLGGMATNGLVAPFMKYYTGDNSINTGIFHSILDRLTKFNEAVYIRAFDPEAMKMVLYDYLLESGVELLLHSYITGAKVKNNKINSLTVENKTGRSEISAPIFIDATGDGDIGAKAGAQIEIGDNEQKTQAVTLIFRIGNVDINKVLAFCKKQKEHFKFIEDEHIVSIAGFSNIIENAKKTSEYSVPLDYIFFTTSPRKDVVIVNSTRILNINGMNAQDLTRAEIEGHRQAWMIFNLLKKNVDGFNYSYILDTANQIGIRETRRIIGEYVLTKEDIINCKKFKDSIGRNNYPIDLHSSTSSKGTWIPVPEGEYYDIPYGCIVAKGVDNLFMAGRCISTDHEAQGSIRIMPVCAITGEAAGKGAAECIKMNILPKQVDITGLI